MIAGGYARISRDEDKGLRGIGKQIEDDRERALELGWTLARLYVDDDLTAAKYDVRRPAFEQMMTDLADGVINAALVWKSDRFTRLDYDLTRLFREHAFKAKGRHGGIKFASKATVYDLDDPATHQRLTIEVSIIGTGEVSAMKERQTREHARKAEQGVPTGGRRGFGYQATPETLAELDVAKKSGDKIRIEAANKRVWSELRYRQDPREAAALRDARNRLLGGEKAPTIAREWNAQGLLTPLGRLWHPSVLRSTIKSPRLAGYRIYRGEIALDRNGQPVFVEGQEPIFTVEEHEEIAAYFAGTPRTRNQVPHGNRTFLLSGLLRCGLCKQPMWGNVVKGYVKETGGWEDRARRIYRCSGAVTSCGKQSINAPKSEAHVIELVARHIDQLTPEIVSQNVAAWDKAEQLKHAEIKRNEWADAIDSGDAPPAFGFAKVSEWDEKIKELKRERQDWQRGHTAAKGRVVDSGKDLRAMGDQVDQQRAVVDRYLSAVLVKKLKQRGPHFQPKRLEPIWIEQ
ncbi:DNA invertase Pin-like site-specific DNA recombinase [Actinoallomurus bryophytorum]|uniref:DNA invertase Pin-like site-specific DNA recombinase n=1 Tax=Actinoallomurus bryophytorum TaxID=1490222 RepID=A0A543CG96_9ACTN|nr:DNA invertase Pin-like site-specific DNA recombinase [Actinoallomurus bryophytorum]